MTGGGSAPDDPPIQREKPRSFRSKKSKEFHGIFPSSTGEVCFRIMSDVFFLLEFMWNVTLPKTNGSPLKIGLPNRKVVFQPSIFRGYGC